jgi:hypothetical protein
MQRQRISPPFKAYAVAPDGSRSDVVANEIVIELGPDLHVVLDLAPHPDHAERLVMRAGLDRTVDEDQQDRFTSSFVIRPGACNVISVFVERWRSRVITSEQDIRGDS